MKRSPKRTVAPILLVVALGLGVAGCGSDDDGPTTTTTTTPPPVTQENSIPTNGNSGAETNAGNGQTDEDSGPSTADNGTDADPGPASDGVPNDTTAGDGPQGTIPSGSGGTG
ncbi:MAG: hypothetical protein KF703_08095 [Actinobacteria bacterium]|nr:hypothetical protein [Actinomycetota bacterium]